MSERMIATSTWCPDSFLVVISDREAIKLNSWLKWLGCSSSSMGILSRPGKGGKSPRNSPKLGTAKRTVNVETSLSCHCEECEATNY